MVGMTTGKKRIYCLSYADDIVVLAEAEEEIRELIKRLDKYLDQKRLCLDVEKTKIMRFKVGGGKMSRIKWKWRGKEVEEVKEFKYLGYRLIKNGSQEAQIRERVKKAATMMRAVWGIGMKLFGKDLKGGYGYSTGWCGRC